MSKKDIIIEYAKRQMLVGISILGFPLVKTTDKFRSNYELHDRAYQFIVTEYSKHGYILTPIGVDARSEKVMVLNALPDYMAERGDDIIFCFDIKAKSKTEYFGYVNKRDAISYKRLAEECNVKVYVIFVKIDSEEEKAAIVGYSNIRDKPIKKERMWDGNVVWIYEWYKGLPEL